MRGHTVLLACLCISISINVALAYQLQQSRKAIQMTGMHTLERGEAVPDFDAVDLQGATHRISYQKSSVPTVIYVFMPQCSWCSRNLDNLRTLLAQRGSEYNFIGISLSSSDLQQYVAKNELSFPIYADMSAATKQQYRLSGTPQTLVISPDGHVIQNWLGAYDGIQKWRVEKFFGLTLPGLRLSSQ